MIETSCTLSITIDTGLYRPEITRKNLMTVWLDTLPSTGFARSSRHLEDSFLDVVASDNKNKIERPQWVGSMRKCGNKKWVLANTQDQTRKIIESWASMILSSSRAMVNAAFNLMKTAVNTENANESPKILQALKASFGIKPREVLYKKRVGVVEYLVRECGDWELRRRGDAKIGRV